MAKPDEKNIHAGHRQRMMERYKQRGFEGWQEHEIAEVLLYNVLPRINTNVHGHRLINAFGSLKKLLEADRHEIESVYGIGPASAEYIAEIRDSVSEKILEQFCGADEINIYQLAFLADWFMRDERKPAGMLILDENGLFADFICVPLQRNGDTINPDTMFSGISRDLTNHTVSLFVKPDHALSGEDIAAVRRYTFARSIILDEIYVMNKREPVPTLHPYNPPKRVE